MKKPFNFTELSQSRCRICNRRLKKNLVERKEQKPICFRCYVKKEYYNGHIFHEKYLKKVGIRYVKRTN